MPDDSRIEKLVWGDNDFYQMGWHDVRLYAIAFGPGEFELSLDIDYIFEWIHPTGSSFEFWVAPCTMVFWNVYNLQLDADFFGEPMVVIDDVRRATPQRPKNADYIGRDLEWRWTIECHHAELSLWSVGYTLYVRRPPVLARQQCLDLSERGGFSFERSFDSSYEKPREA